MNHRSGVSGRWGKNAVQLDTASCPHCGSINQTSEISTKTGFPERVPVTHCKACSKPLSTLAETQTRLYHVTLAENLPSILKHGLQPRIGPLSTLAGEAAPCIFTFNNLGAVEDALMGWLGEHLPEDRPLALLELILPAGMSAQQSETPAGYETCIYQPVPPTAIKVLSNDLDNFSFGLTENAEYNLQARYAHWNKVAFKGELPQIPIEWAKMKRAGGVVLYSPEYPPGWRPPHPVMVRLGKVSKYHGATVKPGSMRMKISTVYHRDEHELDKILLHEMVHVWCAHAGYVGENHGNFFMAKLKEVSGIVGFELPVTDDPVNLELTDQTVKPVGVVLITKPDGQRVFAIMSIPVMTKVLPVLQERAVMFVLSRYAKRVDLIQIATPIWNRIGVELALQRNPKKLKFYSMPKRDDVIPDLVQNGMVLWSHEQHPVVK